jgi:hypothetical protein
LIVCYALYLPGVLAEEGKTVYQNRNFFGVKKVVERGTEKRLLHGDTLHGLEDANPTTIGEPRIYYHRDGPLGDVMRIMQDVPDQHVGVVGLGAGSIAAYANPQRHVTFFEIDPDVELIAEQYFTFLDRCGKNCNVVPGDGRLSISRYPDHEFDLLVLDAFSSDAIPPHLLSKEALDIYVSKLKTDGVLLFHVSNRYLNVKDLVATLAFSAEIPALIRDDKGPGSRSYAVYVMLSKSEPMLAKLRAYPDWKPIGPSLGLEVWTDDYSNLIDLLEWKRR